MRNSSVKSGHMGNFDLEPNKHKFPYQPYGGVIWDTLG